jgi:hypothetical protein
LIENKSKLQTAEAGAMRDIIIIGIIFVSVFQGCTSDAPRDNPLDPENGIRISGKVERFYENRGIKDAMLTLKPTNKATLSTAEGSFVFEGVAAGNYTLVCQASDFFSDSIELDLQGNRSVNFKLDGIPYFEDISITTHHISSFSVPNDSFFVVIQASANDKDGRPDVQKVWYGIEAFDFADTLFEDNPQQKIFSAELNKKDLNINSIQQLAGKPFVLYVEDFPGQAAASEAQYITRIINRVPVGLSPLFTTINSFPFELTWEPVSLPYPFVYDIELKKINFTLISPAGSIKNIPPADTTAVFNGALEAGEYIWELYIVDEFGNRSRSLENPFVVQ